MSKLEVASAILNVSRKLKMTKNEFWEFIHQYHPNCNDLNALEYNYLVDILVKLANKLYKN